MTNELTPLNHPIPNPASSLPSEIVTEIVLRCLPESMDPDGRKAFRNLRQISSLWRTTCFSTQACWTGISLNVSEYAESKESPPTPYTTLLQKWFERSGSELPLVLTLERVTWDNRDEALERLLTLIRSFQARWRFLFIGVGGDSFWHIFQELPAGDWGNNLHLSFTDHQSGRYHYRYSEYIPYTVCPPLKELTIITEQPSAHWICWVGRQAVETLTLNIRTPDPLDCMPRLSQYQRLTTLILIIRTFNPNNRLANPSDVLSTIPITFPNLCTFSLETDTHLAPLRTLKCLHMPTLSDLQVSFNVPVHEDVSSFFNPLLESCSKSLKALSIGGDIHPTNLIQLISSIPATVTKLELPYWPYAFTGDDGQYSNVSLSNLEAICIGEPLTSTRSAHEASNAMGSFVAFVQERMSQSTMPPKLKTVDIKRTSDCHLSSCEELDALREKGLRMATWMKAD